MNCEYSKALVLCHSFPFSTNMKPVSFQFALSILKDFAYIIVISKVRVNFNHNPNHNHNHIL